MVRFRDLVELLTTSVARHGEKPVLGTRAADGTWSWIDYAEFGRRVDDFRGGLASLGVGRGDRVAVISNNRVEWAVACYAAYGLAAMYVPMYENQSAKEWQYILADCGAKVVLVGSAAIAERVAAFAAELPELRATILFDGPAADPRSYAALVAAGRAAPVAALRPDPADVANLIYTSGTTGNPKGVRLSHHNLATNISAGLEVVPELGDDERSLAFLPWAHVYGGSSELHGVMACGGSLAICASTDQIVASLAEVRPTVLFAVPNVWNKIYSGVQKQIADKPAPIRALFALGMRARSKLRKGERPSLAERLALPVAERLIFRKIVERFGGRLKFAISGAAALSRDVAEFIDNLGIIVLEGYGMTECSSGATGSTPSSRRIGSVGKPFPGVTIRLDHDVAGGDADNGEIIIYGHGVMSGYHHLPEETAHALGPDGGLRSGDLGRFDADGFLYVTGRVKELYKMENGKYVAPAPLEERLKLSPYVAQAMIVGADRPFNVALLVPDFEAARAWAASAGVDAAPERLVSDDRFRALIAAEIDRYAAEWKGYERVRKFALVAEDWSTHNGMLTPTLKLKRRNVVARYAATIEELYR